jgi:protein O-GlcNAc transferase
MSGSGVPTDADLASLRQGVALAPDDQSALFALANALLQARQPRESAELCRRALALYPGHPAFGVALFNALVFLGDTDGAWQALRGVVPHAPDHLNLLSELAMYANYAHSPTPEEVLGAHRAYGTALCRVRPGEGGTAITDPDPDRRLRIAFISYDFRRNSSISFFLRPLFEGIDRAHFHIAAFQTRELPAESTGWFRQSADTWGVVGENDHEALARLIRDERTDIAIDINGHTGPRTLPALQPRCAPVQVSYLGYSSTTGVPSIDWRIVDSATDPPARADRLSTERLLRLDPCFLCYRPGEDTPPVSASPPCVRAGHVTFGSLSEISKINHYGLSIWGRVLAAVPGSRLLLKVRVAGDPERESFFRQQMLAAGLDPSRVDLIPRTSGFAEHLATYDRIDISLDTWPYNGTTSVCESIVMGVPFLSFEPAPRHDRHIARVSMSLLRTAGLGELVAPDEHAFVALAASLAGEPEALRAYRATLRARVLASPLCDARSYALRFGQALRAMWRHRVAMAAPACPQESRASSRVP